MHGTDENNRNGSIDQQELQEYCGMNVLKNGVSVYEAYFQGCTSESRMHVYSVTKSIVSILLGIAMDEGYIVDVSQKGSGFFSGVCSPGERVCKG